MNIKIKKLWNGLASVRDYEVKDALLNNRPIKLIYQGKTMTLDKNRLEHGLTTVKRTFKSKFDENFEYSLIDFRWKDDDESKLFN